MHSRCGDLTEGAVAGTSGQSIDSLPHQGLLS